MRKIVVISDSFKGTLDSITIAELAKDVIHQVFPSCQVVGLPVADGGEGTVDCFWKALGGEKVQATVTGPWGEQITASYGRIQEIAVIEMAAAAGLPMVQDRKDPSKTTTYGVGELLRHAIKHGARRIILGLGGSATNDGGCGAGAALGVTFYNSCGQAFCPVGATLSEIEHIDITTAKELLQNVSIEVMCDIVNPLCGENGAAAVFAPQKGADAAMVKQLDQGLLHLASVIESQLGISTQMLPGAGAAGGFGAGAVALLGATLRPGIDVVLDLLAFDQLIQDTDLIITGEGRIDGQSLGGKVPVGIARRAKALGIPVIAIVGIVGDGVEAVYQEGITSIFPTNRTGGSFESIRKRSREDYCQTLLDIMKLIKISC